LKFYYNEFLIIMSDLLYWLINKWIKKIIKVNYVIINKKMNEFIMLKIIKVKNMK